MMNQQALGRLIRIAREAKGLSYGDVSTEKLSANYWRALEGGTLLPTPVQVNDILKALEVIKDDGRTILGEKSRALEAGQEDLVGSTSPSSKRGQGRVQLTDRGGLDQG